jgi:hypothetical protein
MHGWIKRISPFVYARVARDRIQEGDAIFGLFLTDFLASYESVPGTVAYVGYGSLLEKRGWDGAGWLPGEGDQLTTRRGLFVKVSHAKRF